MNLNGVVGSYAEDVSVIRSMVNLAERKPVRHNRVTAGSVVGDDVGGVKKFAVRQKTDRTPRLVGEHHLRGKDRLMQPTFSFADQVTAQRLFDDATRPDGSLILSQGKDELVELGFLGCEVHRRNRLEDTWFYPVEPDDGQLLSHRCA